MFVVVALVLALLGYATYAGLEGSGQLIFPARRASDCRTPATLGWEYEAINYDQTSDAPAADGGVSAPSCPGTWAPAGDDVVTPDGIRVAGWYVPAANGIGPEGPTIVISHGHGSNKSRLLDYAALVHERYNVVLFDYRNHGQSTGTVTTLGVLEQQELRAILDWLEREKGPERIGVLGSSMGAATALREAATDTRVDAMAIDSAHARLSYTIEARVQRAGHPAYPGTWAIFLASLLRTGVDYGAADPLDAVPHLGDRPLLILHGDADTANDLQFNAVPLRDAAEAAGVPVELHVCEDAGHGGVLDTCPREYREWLLGFFDRALGVEPTD